MTSSDRVVAVEPKQVQGQSGQRGQQRCIKAKLRSANQTSPYL